MKFEDAITQYVSDHIDRLELDYQWDFPIDNIPVKISFGNECWLKKNIYLRNALHDAWNNSAQEKRLAISNWYIYEWGRVKTNKPEKLALYASSNPEQLIQRKATGIASWSKSLSVVDPSRFAIFDARVSSSLNSIQIIKNVSNPRYFPDLPGRNNTIVAATAIAKSTIKKKWEPTRKETFYSEYNSLLGNVVTKLGGVATLQTVEMVLFSRAELLANEWCKLCFNKSLKVDVSSSACHAP